MKKILVLSPHPDDGVIGCGGYINKALENGAEVLYVIFSCNKQGFSELEIENSIRELGVAEDRIITLDYPVRRFNEYRQSLLQELIQLRGQFEPDIVLCHSSFDKHQDHEVINNEAKRAFKHTTLLGYDLPWNTKDFRHDAYKPLEEKHISKKIVAMGKCESQSHRRYYNPELRMAQARYIGEKKDLDYAESFEIINLIL